MHAIMGHQMANFWIWVDTLLLWCHLSQYLFACIYNKYTINPPPAFTTGLDGVGTTACIHSCALLALIVCSLGGALADFARGFDHAGLWRRFRFEGASGGGPLLLQLS